MQQPKVEVEISFIYEIVSPVIAIYDFDLSSSGKSDIKQFSKHFDTSHGFKVIQKCFQLFLDIIIIFNICDINNLNTLIYD